ncbi:hypothetical protein DFJ73DRAFT_837931 [Zopfochytrium polystomum]|nr:hypothetical protein DFJ73DRAFT_837931 [Zopfochytrium polystomum]
MTKPILAIVFGAAALLPIAARAVEAKGFIESLPGGQGSTWALATADDPPTGRLDPYQCYNGSNRFGWDRFRAYTASKRQVIIEVDEWDSAILMSRMLQFLLTDVIGFNVTMPLYSGGEMSIPRLSKGTVDVAMELWLSDAGKWYQREVREASSVVDLGSIGYTGRVGLYVPSWVVERRPELSLDFWRFFRNHNALSIFPKAVSHPIVLGTDGNFICDNVPFGCQKGIYLPPHYVEGGDFIQIWAMWPDYSSYVFERLIDGLMLNATIQYLGDQQMDSVAQAIRNQTPVIFYGWKPTTFISSNNVSRILFPDDTRGDYQIFSEDKEHTPLMVDLPSEPLFKAVSTAFSKEFPEISTLITNMHLSETDVNEMLRQIGDGAFDHSQVACQWFLDNEKIWSAWVPPPPQSVESCPAGTGLYQTNGGISVCLSCEPGFFNLLDNNTDSCIICPEGGVCPGGATLNVKSGKWRSPNATSAIPDFYDCPFQSCCEGGNCTVDHLCEDGFAGVLCAECANPNFFLWNQKCIPCESPGSSLYLLIFLSFLATVGVVYLPREEVPTIELLFFYFQVIKLILGPLLGELLGKKGLLTFLEVASLNADGLVQDCPAPLKGLARVTIAGADKKIALWLPRYMRGQSIEHILFRAGKTVFTFTLMPFIEAALALLDCRRVEKLSRVLFFVPSEVCFSGEHVGPGAFAIIILVVFLVMVPLCMSAVLWKLWKSDELDFEDDVPGDRAEVVAHLKKSLYENFKPDYFFMEPVLIWEKGLVVAIFSFFGNQSASAQSVAYIVLFAVLCLSRVYVQPFKAVVEAYLNREVCIGLLLTLEIRFAMAQKDVNLAPLVGLVMFLPAALHMGRWIIFNVTHSMNTSQNSQEDGNSSGNANDVDNPKSGNPDSAAPGGAEIIRSATMLRSGEAAKLSTARLPARRSITNLNASFRKTSRNNLDGSRNGL